MSERIERHKQRLDMCKRWLHTGDPAEVLAEMGGYTATAAHSDFHLSWVIQVPGPGRYMVVKEADDE